MKKKDLIRHFGSPRKISEVFGVTTQAVYKWDDDIVPELIALKADRLTKGKLKYKERDYQ